VKVHLSFERSRCARNSQSRVCAAHIGAQSIPIDATLIVECGLRLVKLNQEASCFEVMKFMKSQTPKTKLQTNFKFQYQMTKTDL